MSALPYPVVRETQRLRRWLHTAGAEYRLVTPVAASAELRDRVLEGLLAEGGMDLRAVDLAAGEVVPAAFRSYRGSHTSYTLFVFLGLGQRVRREGRAALDALENAEALFRRNATWTLLWLEDPALWPLLRRLAPRLAAAVQLHPTFFDPGLLAPGEAQGARDLLAATLARAKPASADPEPAARRLIAEGRLLEAGRLLRETRFEPQAFLLTAGEADLQAGDPQSALAHFAAACALQGDRAAEATGAAAEVLAGLGDAASARAAAERALAATPAPAASARAARALLIVAGRSGADPSEALRALRSAAARDPLSVRAVAATGGRRSGSPALPPVEAIALLREALASASAELEARELLETDLGLALARAGPEHESEAKALLERARMEGEGDDLRSRDQRGLARLALERAVRAVGEGNGAEAEDRLEQAQHLLDGALRLALERSLTLEAIECHWERTSLHAAREDLAGILGALEDILALARTAGLRPVQFDALEQHARALRFSRRLAAAAGELDELESLAYDLTWPELEVRAFEARGDHLIELGLAGEAHAAYVRAAAVAGAVGDERRAASLRARTSGAAPA